MTINLRRRKQTKNGKISLYLELYKGRSQMLDGKTKYLREYEFLNLFLIDKPKKPKIKKFYSSHKISKPKENWKFNQDNTASNSNTKSCIFKV